MKCTYLLVVLLSLMLASCNIQPEPIHYNSDECAYCKMKISDVRFGAELVTAKGKIYKYDSAECLVRTYISDEHKKYAFVLVTDYAQPQNLIDATTATFLISEKQPSPMGGNLSAYDQKEQAESILKAKTGRLLDFNNLVDEYKKSYQ
jgi:copper chaperone NosL